MSAIRADRWIRVADLGQFVPEYREALLARAMTELILLSAAFAADGPLAAGYIYATCAGHVRVSGPDVLVWTGP